MSDLLKYVATAEMEAYDKLPCVIRKVFDEAPRKVSVVRTMALPGVRKAYTNMDKEQFAKVLTNHLAAQAQEEAVYA